MVHIIQPDAWTVERLELPGPRPAARTDAPDDLGRRQRALLAGRGRGPSPARGRRALPTDRRQPHDPVLPADLPRRDDPDPPTPEVPPDSPCRRRSRHV